MSSREGTKPSEFKFDPNVPKPSLDVIKHMENYMSSKQEKVQQQQPLDNESKQDYMRRLLGPDKLKLVRSYHAASHRKEDLSTRPVNETQAITEYSQYQRKYDQMANTSDRN
jgi:hypothetical protein